jgi:hypothetical protein
MKQDKLMAVGLFLVLFASFLVLAYMTTFPKEYTVNKPESEGFQVGPTRASDCRCLQGYIPSNMVNSKYGGRFITDGGLVAFQPQGSKTKHLISSCLVCEGVNPCTQKKMIPKKEWDSLQWGEQYSCPLFTQIKKKAKKTSDTFFCQSTSDPEKSRDCY